MESISKIQLRLYAAKRKNGKWQLEMSRMPKRISVIGRTPIVDGKRVRDAAFFFIIMLVTFAATLLNPQKYVSSRTIQKCVEHVSTST